MRLFGILAAVGILGLFGAGLLLSLGTTPDKPIGYWDIGVDIIAFFVLVAVGAFGGYLSGLQHEPTSNSPDDSRKFFRRAILHGAAGAIIIFTLAPIDPDIIKGLFSFVANHEHPQVFIKLIALALIGGYAGSALLESSAVQFSQRINELTQGQQDIKEEQKSIKDDQKSIKEEQKKAADALNLVEQALHGLDVDIEALNNAVADSSPLTRSEIYSRAEENRRENWENNKEHMERSLAIFAALTATKDVQHWWCGSLAYCLKDKRRRSAMVRSRPK